MASKPIAVAYSTDDAQRMRDRIAELERTVADLRVPQQPPGHGGDRLQLCGYGSRGVHGTQPAKMIPAPRGSGGIHRTVWQGLPANDDATVTLTIGAQEFTYAFNEVQRSSFALKLYDTFPGAWVTSSAYGFCLGAGQPYTVEIDAPDSMPHTTATNVYPESQSQQPKPLSGLDDRFRTLYFLDELCGTVFFMSASTPGFRMMLAAEPPPELTNLRVLRLADDDAGISP